MIPPSLVRPYFPVRTTASFCLVLGILAFLGLSHSLPVTVPSVTAPYVHTTGKRSDVVCGAASWEDVVAFFLLNYFAHAATIRHFPGDSTPTQFWWTACALFLPFAGVWRACQSIANARPFEKDPLERAKYAGALCTAECPPPTSSSTELHGCQLKGELANSNASEGDGFVRCAIRILDSPIGERTVGRITEKIHGATASAVLTVVPPFVKVLPNSETTRVRLSCSNGLLKSAAAVVQLLFACLTLYRTKGGQVEMYGYAAFGLTVIPYAIMSILNLTANLLTPEYPMLFMVQSDGMRIRQLGYSKPQFDGIVGTIVPENARTDNSGFYDTISARDILRKQGKCQGMVQIPEDYVEDQSDGELEVLVLGSFGRHETTPTFDRTQKIRNLVAIAIGIAALVIPYVLIAIFSHGFETGTESTTLQRGFVMSWLVVGQVFGAISGWLGHSDSTAGNLFYNYQLRDREGYFSLLLLVAVITPAVGGFVVVGLMIKQFGSCVLV